MTELEPMLMACDSLTKTIQEFANLQPSIQTAQAVYLGQGPYAGVREYVDRISKKYLNSGTVSDEDSISVDSGSESGQTSGGQTCPKCKDWFPYHALEFHENKCSANLVSKTPRTSKEDDDSVAKKSKKQRDSGTKQSKNQDDIGAVLQR